MREQRFGMYLPVLILIAMEVFSMLHDSKGATASVAQRWSKRSRGNAIKMKPLGATYYLREPSTANTMIPTRGNKARTNGKRIAHSVIRNFRKKNPQSMRKGQTWLQHDESPIKNTSLCKLPLVLSNTATTSFANLVDPALLDINEPMPRPVLDIDQTNPDLELYDDKQEHDCQSPIVRPDSLLTQIVNSPKLDINEINPDLQPNDLESLLDSLLTKPTIITIVDLLIPVPNPMEPYVYDSKLVKILRPASVDSQLAYDRSKLFQSVNGYTDPSWRSTRQGYNCSDIPSDYHLFGDISLAYKFYDDQLHWDEAEMVCESDNAVLALPEDEQQYDLMVGYANGVYGDSSFRFWAGFSRISFQGIWTTANGDPLPFEKWASDDTSDELVDKLCGGVLVSDDGDDGFTSENCVDLLPFICEMSVNPECT